MGVREGGSYVADPATGEESLVARTAPADAPRPAVSEPQPAPDPPAAGKPSRRPSAPTAEQE